MKTKINYLFIALLLVGCQANKTKNQGTGFIAPPPPPKILPSLPPPNFTTDINEVKEIQVNRLPHPFNLNGNTPYAVWVDGKRLQLSRNEVKSLAVALNLKFTQPEDTAEIHNGEGWLYPKKLDRAKDFPPLDNIADKEEEEKEEEFDSPEIFIDN